MPPRRRGPSATTSLHAAPRPGGDRFGSIDDASRRGEFASVISYQSDRYTATVRTESGRTITIPQMRATSGQVSALAAGTEVLVCYDYGAPFILGILNMPASGNEGSIAPPVTEVSGFGGDGFNQSQVTTRGNYRGASEPRDIVPGDWVQVSTEGAMVALLSGGVAQLKAGVLSQIRAHLLTDLVEIISRNFRHVTDMGEFTITNNDGRINMRFRGASDQRSEAGVDEERWTIQMDLGAEGDLFNFELCTTEGQTLFKFHVDSSGHCEIFGVNGVTTSSGSRAAGGHAEEHSGDSASSVGGDRVYVTAGAVSHGVGGSVATTTGGDHTTAAGNDLQVQATRDLSLSAGRNLFVAAQGGDGDNALTANIDGGNILVTIGSETSPDHGFEMDTFAGDMLLKSTQGGAVDIQTNLGDIKATAQTIKLITSQMDSVILGGDTLASHLVKFEELKQMLQQLLTALDTHTHPVAGATASAPTVPIGAPLLGSLDLFKSLKAGVSS